MAKRNVKTNEEVVEQPKTDVQPIQETTGNPDSTQAEKGGNLKTAKKNFRLSRDKVVVNKRMAKGIPAWILKFKKQQLAKKGVELVIKQ
jgi:hypothetical protein